MNGDVLSNRSFLPNTAINRIPIWVSPKGAQTHDFGSRMFPQCLGVIQRVHEPGSLRINVLEGPETLWV